MGIEKYAVLLQQMLEICLVAIAAFPLAYLASREMAGTLGTLFGKAAENVIVTPQHFVLVTAAGVGLLIIAVLVSCIRSCGCNRKPSCHRWSKEIEKKRGKQYEHHGSKKRRVYLR